MANFFYLARNYFSSSVKRKIMFTTMLILLLVVSFIQIVIYKIAIPLQTRDAIENNAQEVSYISARIDQMISYYNWISDSITMDDEIQNILKTPYESRKEELTENFYLEQKLLSKSIISSNVFGNLYIYDTQKLRSKISNTIYFDSKYLELNPTLYNSKGSILWLVEHENVYINRAIRDRNTLEIIGYMTLSINENYLQEHIRSMKEHSVYLFNEMNNLVISDRPMEKLPSEDVLQLTKELENGHAEVLNIKPFGKFVVSVYQSSFSLWKVVSMVPLQEITKSSDITSYWIILIGLAGIIIGSIILWYSSNHIIMPLKELRKIMDHLDIENFSQRVKISRRDEFGRLGKSFNRMMEKIETLVSQVYIKELNRKEAEYKALKAQINPHFLYNTLETVRWLAEYGETEQIANVSIALAKLLKASISNQEEFIPIREEKEYLLAYISIQKTRFQDKVDVSLQLEESILSYKIPRLLLQPIIENAFIHGLEKKRGKGYLIIKGGIIDQNIVFQVIDNGLGMEQAVANSLVEDENVLTATEYSTGTKNGLLNVQKRIQLIFGLNYGLKIISTMNVGTIVEMKIPCQT